VRWDNCDLIKKSAVSSFVASFMAKTDFSIFERGREGSREEKREIVQERLTGR
jgi:hypothetical protein